MSRMDGLKIFMGRAPVPEGHGRAPATSVRGMSRASRGTADAQRLQNAVQHLGLRSSVSAADAYGGDILSGSNYYYGVGNSPQINALYQQLLWPFLGTPVGISITNMVSTVIRNLPMYMRHRHTGRLKPVAPWLKMPLGTGNRGYDDRDLRGEMARGMVVSGDGMALVTQTGAEPDRVRPLEALRVDVYGDITAPVYELYPGATWVSGWRGRGTQMPTGVVRPPHYIVHAAMGRSP